MQKREEKRKRIEFDNRTKRKQLAIDNHRLKESRRMAQNTMEKAYEDHKFKELERKKNAKFAIIVGILFLGLGFISDPRMFCDLLTI